MKLINLLEDEENTMIIPLYWLTRENRMKLIRNGYQVIPIPGYQKTNGCQTFQIIGKNKDIWQISKYSIPIWKDWKLTAKYTARIEYSNSTSGQQMFDHLDNAEKIQSLKYSWYSNTVTYIKQYFRDHPDMIERARYSLDIEEIDNDFKELFL